jgi:hypothetical protein
VNRVAFNGAARRLAQVNSMGNYLKSGAVSRHHYAVIHKVENASSAQEAEVAIWAEVDRIKADVAHGLVSLLQTRRANLMPL